MSEPKPAIQMKDKDYDPILLGPVKAIPPNWTVWDKITIKQSMTCKELIDYVKKEYNVEVTDITCGSVNIIQMFMSSSKARLPQKIEDVYNTNAKVKLNDTLFVDTEARRKHKNAVPLCLQMSGSKVEAMRIASTFAIATTTIL